MRIARWLVLGLVEMCTACVMGLAPAAAQSLPARPPDAVTLQVPYVSQSVLLCGGAAIAMIERWWGRRGVFAEDFAALVRPDEGGIRTTDLARTMQLRGWDTQAFATTPERVQQSIADSVPVVALIRVAAKRYHYVVILGWTEGKVTYHDPAVSPAVMADSSDFMRRWRGANSWAMIARPMATTSPVASAPTAPSRPAVLDSLPCRPWLDQAADAAGARRLDDADKLLATAAAQCPSEALVLREQAGVRFRQGRLGDAMLLADAYSRRAPTDTLGWQLLASSRYLAGDTLGALAAWNRVGQPVIDLLRIDGSSRIRFAILRDLMNVPPGSVLTARRLALAQRRIGDVPAASAARVGYVAVEGGAVEARASLVERPVLAPFTQLLAMGAFDAIRRDARLSFASLIGAGEVWTVQYRWQNADPRTSLRVAIPYELGIPTIVRLERSWEQYRFAGALADEKRNTTSVGLTAWMRPGVEGLLAWRHEDWSALGSFQALTGGVGLHDARDRAAVLFEGEHAFPRDGAPAYDRLRVRSAWSPPVDRWRNTWSMRLGAEWSGAGTPLGLRPIAGGALARDIPLRAHQYIVDDVLPSARIARSIVHGGIAGDRSLGTRGPFTFGAGLFVDAAQLLTAADGPVRAPLYVDAGAGLRIGFTGARWATIRIDVARGLVTDRGWGVSAGPAPRWPVRLGRSRDGR